MWLLSGLVHFLVLGGILGLEESEMREELAWSEIIVVWGLIESFARDPLGLVCGSRKESCIFLGFGGVSGSEGIWGKARAWLIRVGSEEWVFW